MIGHVSTVDVIGLVTAEVHFPFPRFSPSPPLHFLRLPRRLWEPRVPFADAFLNDQVESGAHNSWLSLVLSLSRSAEVSDGHLIAIEPVRKEQTWDWADMN